MGVSDLFEQPDDATPLTPEEMRELIPAHIANRREPLGSPAAARS